MNERSYGSEYSDVLSLTSNNSDNMVNNSEINSNNSNKKYLIFWVLTCPIVLKIFILQSNKK